MSTTDFDMSLDQRVQTRFEKYSTEARKRSCYNWYMDVSTSSMYEEGYVDDEGSSDVGRLVESGQIKRIEDSEGYSAFLVADEYAGEILVTYKEKLRGQDDSTVFKKFLSKRTDKAIISMERYIENSMAKFFNDGFAGAKVKAPDGVEIFGTHAFKTGKGSFTNKGTINGGADAMAVLEKYAGAFTGPQGANDAQPLMFDEIYVKSGGDAATAFKKVFKENGVKATTVSGVNIYDDGRYKLIEIPYITSTTAWFAQDSSMDNAFVLDFIEKPNVKEAIRDKNLNESRPVVGSWKEGVVSLPTGWYGSTGTTTDNA